LPRVCSSSSSGSRAASPFSSSANMEAAAAGSMAAAGVDATPEPPSFSSSEPALPADGLFTYNGLAGSSSSSAHQEPLFTEYQSVPAAADSTAAPASAGISGGEAQVADTPSDSDAGGGEISGSISSSSTGEPLEVSEEPGRLSVDGPGTPAVVSVPASCASSPRASCDEAGDGSSDNVLPTAGSKQQQREGGLVRGLLAAQCGPSSCC
jgi:hypothetical protein